MAKFIKSKNGPNIKYYKQECIYKDNVQEEEKELEVNFPLQTKVIKVYLNQDNR